MKKHYLPYILLLFIGCKAAFPVSTIPKKNYLGYIPIDPLPVSMVSVYDHESNRNKEVYWKSITNADTVRSLLPLQSAQVSISKIDANGKINYTAASLSGEVGSYKVIMDYMKYMIQDVYDNDHKYIGSGRIGVGLRIKAEIVTSKVNLNVGSITAMGLEASMSNLSGGISIDIIGIDSENVTNLIPLTSEIDQSSIQSALQALASIKSKLWEKETRITPHLVAVQQSVPDSDSKIRKELLITKFLKSEAGDIIRSFWKPDGNTINRENEAKLKEWMETNRIDSGAGSITMFLRGEAFESLRIKAVKDLNLNNN